MLNYLLLVLAIEVPLFIWAVRRSGVLPFPHVFMLYVMFGQIFLWLNAAELLVYAFVDSFSTYVFIDRFPFVISFFSLFFFGSLLCVPRQRSSIPLAQIVAGLSLNQYFVAWAIAFLWIRLLIQLALMNWDILLLNREYLLMSSPSAFSVQNSFTYTLGSTQRLFAIFTVVLFAYVYSRRETALALAIAPLLAWQMLFELAGSSRHAVALLLVGALAFWFFGRRKFAMTLGAAAIPTLFVVLSRRGTGQFGFSTLGQIVDNLSHLSIGDSLGELGNVFEGMFVTSEYFSGPIDYGWIYKILSFSPLISIIDGFETIRLAEEVRITYYVPNSAITEALNFGIVYAAVFFGVQFAAGYMSARLLVTRPTQFALALNIVFLFSVYLQFTYSVRTIFRLLLLVLIVAWYIHRRPARRVRKQFQDRTLAASRWGRLNA